MCSVGKEWFGMYYYIGGEYILHTGMFNSFAKHSGVVVLPILATKSTCIANHMNTYLGG